MKTFIKNVVGRIRDRRQDPRYALYGSFPGEFKGRRGETYHVLPVDISRRGLGLLIDPSPAEGDKVELDLTGEGHANLCFAIKHVHDSSIVAISGLKDMKRCGLELTKEQEEDLLHYFASFDSLMIQE